MLSPSKRYISPDTPQGEYGLIDDDTNERTIIEAIFNNYILYVLEPDSGYTVKYSNSPSGKGLYSIVYCLSCPNMYTVYTDVDQL